MAEPDTLQLTDEQREQLLRSMASAHAAILQLVQACIPILRAAADQFVLHTEALKQAGLLDEDGKPVKPCGAGSNAPNALGNERCTLPAGHDGRHCQGITTWPRDTTRHESKEQ